MLPMLTATVRPTVSRLWLLVIGLFAAFALAFATSPPDLVVPDIVAPAFVVPLAAIAIVAIVGYAFSETLLATKARTLFLITALAGITTLTYLAPVLAQAADPADGVVRPTESTVITLDATVLSFLVGSVLPLLTALATKLNASSAVKGVVNLVLSVAGGVLAAFMANSGSLTLIEIASAAIVVYLGSGATYSHLWKPLGTPQAIASATENKGVG